MPERCAKQAANLYGANKMSLNMRKQFTEEHMEQMRDSAERPLTGKRWWMDADEPWQCLAVCKEICRAIDSGNPASYLSHLPVHQVRSPVGSPDHAADVLFRRCRGRSPCSPCPASKPLIRWWLVLYSMPSAPTADALKLVNQALELTPGCLPGRLVQWPPALRSAWARLYRRAGRQPHRHGFAPGRLQRNRGAR